MAHFLDSYSKPLLQIFIIKNIKLITESSNSQ